MAPSAKKHNSEKIIVSLFLSANEVHTDNIKSKRVNENIMLNIKIWVSYNLAINLLLSVFRFSALLL